jgi:hypothetical protein
VVTEPSERSDLVVLRTPRDQGSLPVMRVVIGGMASRHALSVDRLDDVELAVETLFREEPPEGGDFILTVAVIGDTFRVSLGGLRSPLVRRTLSGACAAVGNDRFGPQNILRLIMDSLVDEYRTADGAGPGSFAVEMEKRIP